MKPSFRSFGSQPLDPGLGGQPPLLGKFGPFEDGRAHNASPMLSQGFSQRADAGLSSTLPGRGSSQNQNLLLSQPPFSLTLASQGLATRPLSSGSTFNTTPNQPGLSGVFRPGSAPSQHPTASQLSHPPGGSTQQQPWLQASQGFGRQETCADPEAPSLQLGGGRAGPHPLLQKKQLSLLGKPSPPSSMQSLRPHTAPTLQQPGPKGLRGAPGASCLADVGAGQGLGGPSSRFAPAAPQGGFRAAANSRSLLPMESQQEDEAYLLSQHAAAHSSQQQLQRQHSTPAMNTQDSAGMGWEVPSSAQQARDTQLQQGQRANSDSMLAAGQQQRLGCSAASLEATQATALTNPSCSQQQTPSLPAASTENNEAPAGTVLAAAPAGCKQTTGAAAQTPTAPNVSTAPHASAAAAAALPDAQHAPAAAAPDATGGAAPDKATPQQELLLSRISSLEEHCSSMQDIIQRDIPLLLQQQEHSSKQLQELTAAAGSAAATDTALQAQLQHLTSSVSSFMAEFKSWQEQHAGQGSTVLSHAECQTTPGLQAAAAAAGQGQKTAAGSRQCAAGADSQPAGSQQPSGTSSNPNSSMRPGKPSKPASGARQQASRQSGSLMDFLFSQPPAEAAGAAAAAAGPRAPSGLTATEPKAVLSPSGARFQRQCGRTAVQQLASASPSLDPAAAADGAQPEPQRTHSPFAVGMLAAAPAQPQEEAAKDTLAGAGGSLQLAAAAAGKKPAAKGKAAGAGVRKGRGKKAAAAVAAATSPSAAAPARGGSRRQSARCAQRKAQQQKSGSDGLTQSKLPCQRNTRSVAAAAAALGVELDGEAVPGDVEGDAANIIATAQRPQHAANTAAAAAAGEAPDGERSLKRCRTDSGLQDTAAASADDPAAAAAGVGVQQQAEKEGAIPGWAAAVPLGQDSNHHCQQQQQQQQALIPFSRHRQQQQQPAASLPGAAAPAGGCGPQRVAVRATAAPAGPGRLPDKPSSSAPPAATAAASAGATGKRDRTGRQLYGHTPAAAGGAAPAGAAASGGVAARVAASSRRASQTGAGAVRGPGRHAAATSSAVLLFGDVEDDGDSSRGALLQGRVSSASAGLPAAAAAGGRAQQGAPSGRPVSLLRAPPAAAKAASAAGAAAQRPPVLLPTAAGPGAQLPPLPAAAAATRVYQFGAESDDEDTDTDNSLVRQAGDKQKQQQQRLVDEAELARQVAARMARHRSKQQRGAVSRQGVAASGGGQSGFSVGMGLPY